MPHTHDIIKVQQEIALFVVAIILASYSPFEVTKIYVEQLETEHALSDCTVHLHFFEMY